MTGAERIAGAFASARAAGRRAALMPYVMTGFPDLATARAIGDACVRAGADLLEIGVPFTDPLADGPVIHAAATRALAAGASMDAALELAGHLARSVPVVLMTYVNPVLARGAERFTRELVDAGASGLIVPDVPLEEADELLAACDAAGLALVPLAAPTSTEARLRTIGERARGFVYAVSVVGTTGERAALDVGEVIARAKAHAAVPVALGFGISTPAQAAQAAAAGADGVIVASRLIREASGADDPAAAVGEAVAELAAGLRDGAV